MKTTILTSNTQKGVGIYLLLFILIISSLCVDLYAENGYISNILITFPSYPELTALWFESTAIYTCSNDCVVVLGTSKWALDPEGSELFYYPSIVKLDPQGLLLWQRTLLLSDGVHITGIDIDPDDTVNFFITYNMGGEIHKYEIDTNGVISSSFVSDYLCLIAKALRMPIGDIVFVGTRYMPYSGTQTYADHVAFYRMSSTGDILASAFFPPDTNNSDLGNACDVVLDQNGYLLVTCYLSQNTASVLKVDTDGNLIQRYDLIGNSEQYVSDGTIHISRLPEHSYSRVVYWRYNPNSPYNAETVVATISDEGIGYQYLNIYSPKSILEIDESLYLIGHGSAPYSSGIFSFINTVGYELDWFWTSPMIDFYDPLASQTTDLLAKSSTNCIFAAGQCSAYLSVVKLLPNGLVPICDDVIEPTDYYLKVYPNPFNPSTTISFNLPSSTKVKLTTYNTRGQKVRELADQDMQKGIHTIVWDGRDDQQRKVASGIYFLRLQSGAQSVIRKVLVLK